jgi:hypothetical protein
VSAVQEIRSRYKIGLITSKEWTTAGCRNAPFIINQPEEEIVDVLETDGDISRPEEAT